MSAIADRLEEVVAAAERKGAPVECTRCHNEKKPLGRSAPVGVHMCDRDCPGYMEAPEPDELWPGESAEEFGYTWEILLIRNLAHDLARLVITQARALEVTPCRGVYDDPGVVQQATMACRRCRALAEGDELARRLGT